MESVDLGRSAQCSRLLRDPCRLSWSRHDISYRALSTDRRLSRFAFTGRWVMLSRNLSSITLSRHWLPCSVSLLTIGLLSACGGGGGSDPSTPPQNQVADGIWTSQYTVSSGANAGDNVDAVAVVSSATNQWFAAARNLSSGCADLEYGTSVDITGNDFTATNIHVVLATIGAPSCIFPDGSQEGGTATLSGNLTTESVINVTGGTLTTTSGTQYPAQATSYNFAAVYNKSVPSIGNEWNIYSYVL